MIAIRDEKFTDVGARDALLDACFGDARFLKASERIREGRLPADGLSRVAALDGRLLGTVRLWNVDAGDRPALLLGPLAVDPSLQGFGIGTALMKDALERATAFGHGAILLVGDEAYYARFGFSVAARGGLNLVGDYDPTRFLGLALRPGSLAGATGSVVPAGRFDPAIAWRRGEIRAAA